MEASSQADSPPLAIEGADDPSLWQPPTLVFDVRIVGSQRSVLDVWHDCFKSHHYLTGQISCGAYHNSFIVQHRATGSKAAFHASTLLPGQATFMREHRLVVLPAWQGFGIGPKLSMLMAQRWNQAMAEKGYKFNSKTAHPRLGEIRQNDPCWVPTSGNLTAPATDFGDIGSFGGRKLP